MYNVRILRIFPYFYHCLTLLVFSCLFWISNKSLIKRVRRDGRVPSMPKNDNTIWSQSHNMCLKRKKALQYVYNLCLKTFV
jgi:hypothetical protein